MWNVRSRTRPGRAAAQPTSSAQPRTIPVASISRSPDATVSAASVRTDGVTRGVRARGGPQAGQREPEVDRTDRPGSDSR